MSTISSDCQDMINRNCSAIREDLIGQKKIMSKMESRFQKSVNQIRAADTKPCDCQDDLPKWSDLDELKKCTLNLQQSVINDVETLKIFRERHEAKLKSVSNLLATTANHNEVTSDIKTLRSKYDSLDVRLTRYPPKSPAVLNRSRLTT